MLQQNAVEPATLELLKRICSLNPFENFAFNIDTIKVDFILYPFKWLYLFETIESARLIAVQDIIPIKLQALSNRFSKKDFWDIAFLLNSFPLSEMLEIFKSKFPQIDTGYIIHSLTNFEDLEREPNPVELIPKTWEKIKTELQKAVIEFTNSSF